MSIQTNRLPVSVNPVQRAPEREPTLRGRFSVRTTLVCKSLSVFDDRWRPGKADALENIDARPD
jgi:hypothetical protein